MDQLFTYTSLGTLAGATTATVIVMRFLKQIWPFRLIQTQWMIFVVAQGIILITNAATGRFSGVDVPIYFLNGLLVTTSAMGSWEWICKKDLLHGLTGERGSRDGATGISQKTGP